MGFMRARLARLKSSVDIKINKSFRWYINKHTISSRSDPLYKRVSVRQKCSLIVPRPSQRHGCVVGAKRGEEAVVIPFRDGCC